MTPATSDERYLELSPREPVTDDGMYAVDTDGVVHRVDPEVWDAPDIQPHQMDDGTILTSALSAEQANRLYLEQDIDARPVDIEHDTLPTAAVRETYTAQRHRIEALEDGVLTHSQAEAYVLRVIAECRRKHVATALQRDPSTLDSQVQTAHQHIAAARQTYSALPSSVIDPVPVLALTTTDASFYVFEDGAVLFRTGEDFHCYECGVYPESPPHELDDCPHGLAHDGAHLAGDDIPELELDALMTPEVARALVDSVLDDDRAFEAVVERIDAHENFSVAVE